MQIKTSRSINEDIVSVDLTVSSLGTSILDAETERNQLSNFVQTIEYSKIDFKANMKVVDNVPKVTDEPVDGTTVVEISITDLINKQYILDENLHISFAIDTTKIADSELDDVFTSKAMLGQARVILFAEKVRETIAEKLAEIRALANTFEGDNEVVL